MIGSIVKNKIPDLKNSLKKYQKLLKLYLYAQQQKICFRVLNKITCCIIKFLCLDSGIHSIDGGIE